MPQDVDTLSAASVGSRPVAWAVFINGEFATACDFQSSAKEIADDANGDIVPLYRQPTLTETDCKAIRRAKAVACEMHDSRLEAALGHLLERLG